MACLSHAVDVFRIGLRMILFARHSAISPRADHVARWDMMPTQRRRVRPRPSRRSASTVSHEQAKVAPSRSSGAPRAHVAHDSRRGRRDLADTLRASRPLMQRSGEPAHEAAAFILEETRRVHDQPTASPLGDERTGRVEWFLYDDAKALAALMPQWQRLAGSVPERSVFASPQWALTWWTNFGGGRTLRIAGARRAGELVALAPFCTRRRC